MNRLVISYGGGVNSLAMLIGYISTRQVIDAIVFTDTLGEKPKTYDYLKNVLAPWLKKQTLPSLTVVSRAQWSTKRKLRTGDLSLESECLRLGYMPSRAYGYSTCADKWKLDPFMWWCRERWPSDLIIRAIGFDADESRRVDIAQDKGFGKTYPLIEWGWTREDCEAKIASAGLPIPPKSACYYCPSSTKTEVIALAKEEPLLFRRAIEMESAALANGKSRIIGLGRHWSWKALVEADEDTRKKMSESPVEGCTVCRISS